MASRKAKTPRPASDTPDTPDTAQTSATVETNAPMRKPPQRKIPASDAVRSEWLRRVEAEYRSAAITQHLCLWLIQVGASPDLVELGLRIVSDELAHARLSHLVHTAAHGEGAPTLVRETLALKRHEREPLEHDIIRTGVEIFCLGETVAVPLFAEIRRPCVVPSARRALDRILRDEVRHRDFGWTLLGWLLEQPYADVLRPIIVAELPAMFQRLRRSYGVSRPNAPRALPEDDRAWGLMPIGLYGDILEKTVLRDYVPRFAKVGIDAAKAWSAV